MDVENKVVNSALTKERLISWGFYNLATAYQLMHVSYLKGISVENEICIEISRSVYMIRNLSPGFGRKS